MTNIYRLFPTEESCILFLEKIRWKGAPSCPYCFSTYTTAIKKECRHYCRHCKTSFSVTVNTPFHHSHIDLRKWFLCAVLVVNAKDDLSARHLARMLGVNKNTAWTMVLRIKVALLEQRELLMTFAAHSITSLPTHS